MLAVVELLGLQLCKAAAHLGGLIFADTGADGLGYLRQHLLV